MWPCAAQLIAGLVEGYRDKMRAPGVYEPLTANCFSICKTVSSAPPGLPSDSRHLHKGTTYIFEVVRLFGVEVGGRGQRHRDGLAVLLGEDK